MVVIIDHVPADPPHGCGSKAPALQPLICSPMWYRPIQSVASTSSLMSQEITRWLWPRVSWYEDAASEERLSDVTRSVSLLARWSPTPAVSCWLPDDVVGEEGPASPASWTGP